LFEVIYIDTVQQVCL